MRCDQSSRARRGAGFFVISILSVALLTGAQQGNRAAAGDAATVGQHVPGPSSRRDLGARDGGARPITDDPTQARQQREQRKLRLEKLREHANQLAEMAKSLQEEIEKSNENILAVDVTEKAKKIEKLAGKIRSESRY
jgi:hypothetical protein